MALTQTSLLIFSVFGLKKPFVILIECVFKQQFYTNVVNWQNFRIKSCFLWYINQSVVLDRCFETEEELRSPKKVLLKTLIKFPRLLSLPFRDCSLFFSPVYKISIIKWKNSKTVKLQGLSFR